MKNILFPTDFSANSIHAMQFAIMIAKKTQSVITVLHVYTIPAASPYTIPLDTQLLLEEFKENSENMMEKFKNDIQNQFDNVDLPPIVFKNDYGPITDTITFLSEEINADLIVMSTAGINAKLDGLIGSTTFSVIEKSHCPVFAIPPQAILKDVEHIIYAADLEESELSSLKEVINFSSIFNAKTTILHVKESEIEKKSHDDMFQLLKKEFSSDKINFEVVQNHVILDGIENYINQLKPDVVALAKKNKGFWGNIFHKSITKHFSHTSQLPLFILHKLS